MANPKIPILCVDSTALSCYFPWLLATCGGKYGGISTPTGWRCQSGFKWGVVWLYWPWNSLTPLIKSASSIHCVDLLAMKSSLTPLIKSASSIHCVDLRWLMKPDSHNSVENNCSYFNYSETCSRKDIVEEFQENENMVSKLCGLWTRRILLGCVTNPSGSVLCAGHDNRY